MHRSLEMQEKQTRPERKPDNTASASIPPVRDYECSSYKRIYWIQTIKNTD
jgi:hypothetical protein